MSEIVDNVARRWTAWGVALGFALGGFFDGILLHQILQWHHLLSLVAGVDTLRAQVLWDGYFHALMYVIALVALVGLWRSRGQSGGHPSRALGAALLVGFGLWHVVDSILSHWLLGIHRIRVDSPNPLLWDLLWLVAFGVIPLGAGWLVLRKQSSGGGRDRATVALSAVGLLAMGMGAWSYLPPDDQPYTTVVFAPWVRPADALNAIVDNGGRLVWTDPKLSVTVVDVPSANRRNFYSHGALLVSGAGQPAGCFAWVRT